jgi:small subunit ribosomal protein S21
LIETKEKDVHCRFLCATTTSIRLQREGVFREMRQRRAYEKPSERKAREKSDAIRRARKLARKKAQREGLIPDTRKKKIDDKRSGQRPGMGGGSAGDRFATPRF